MRSKYRKLKLTILLQAVFVTALTILAGTLISEYFLEDSSNELVRIITTFHVQEETARHWYWQVLGNHKNFFLLIGFLVLFSLFFYVALSRLVKYLWQVEDGIDNITSDSEESIQMITELKPIQTKLGEIKYTLKRQEREAAEAEKKKNDLVVFLAHDLKTPLTSVVAYLTMLDSHPDMSAEEREHYTHIALEKSLRLGGLINEFFEITKFNLQNIELDLMELNLTMMLEQLVDELYGVLQQRNLVCEVDAEDDLMIDADPDKLARVFDNILKNAIAYCDQGSTIRVSAGKTDSGIRIVFTNKGRYIPKEKLDTIFEKFYRLDEARHSETGGAGLGLAIAKQLVELHQGSIHAESDEGEVRFIVELPDKEKGIKDEIYTHSRRSSGGRTRGAKNRK